MARDPDYLSKRPDSGIYFYVRRVPKAVAAMDPRGIVRRDLGTRVEFDARVKAREINAANEALWAAFLTGKNENVARARYEAALRVAEAHGFGYRPMADLLQGDGDELLTRIEAVQAAPAKPVADALLGAVDQPQVMLSNLFTEYEKLKAAEFLGMSPNQLRKHKVPRRRAIEYAVTAIGDKALHDVTKADVRKFRDWWVKKMLADGLKADSLNRSFSDIKGMLAVIDAAHGTEFRQLWSGTRIKATNATKADRRLPFSNEFMQTTFLKPGALDFLNVEARLIVYRMVETGLSPSEAANLRAEDIFVGDEEKIPHVVVPEREDRRLKTDYRPRKIPLVGVSLWAFRQAPRLIERYADKEDTLSTLVNRLLLAHGLRPSTDHTLYSLRHNFQDRILNAKALDRVQADLMGHGFDRPEYGEGASLELKLEVLRRIQFKWTAPAGN